MSRRRRIALVAAAAACLALAAGLFVLAADVARWRAALAADDVRWRAVPDEPGLWQPGARVPGDPARLLLSVDDDVRFREALRALRLGRLELGFSSDPALALPRAEAQARLARVFEEDPSPARSSRALGLIGVIGFANSLFETRGQLALVREAVAAFEAAIAIDPANDEAKANLEQALQRRQALEALAGAGAAEPTPGGAGARGAGTANTGSGY
jgi:tetratricopeptide (TPR) repeat protein